MIRRIRSFSFRAFYSKSLFERLIIYVILSEVLAKVYVELLLRDLLFYHPQTKQWIFYAFLGADYLINLPKLIRLRVSFNPMSAFALTLLFMIAHGAIIGIINNNPWFPLINDIIPLFMIALNILRMQSAGERTYVDFPSLFRITTILTLCSSLLSFTLLKAHVISVATLIPNAIYLAMFFAALYTHPKLPRWQLIAFLVIMGIGGAEVNRTTMMFLALSVCGYVAIMTIRQPLKGAILFASVAIGGFLVWHMLPEDSGAYKRIVALEKLDLNSREGSVGERAQEWDSISRHLSHLGSTDELMGFGMGGTYTMKFTHEVEKGYGHAHYSWAWFKMRFGQIGFIYLGILIATLFCNLLMGLKRWNPTSMFIAFISLSCILYLGTYVNAIWLLSGLQFLWLPRADKHPSLKGTQPA
jgi:hypothetical protein